MTRNGKGNEANRVPGEHASDCSRDAGAGRKLHPNVGTGTQLRPRNEDSDECRFVYSFIHGKFM